MEGESRDTGIEERSKGRGKKEGRIRSAGIGWRKRTCGEGENLWEGEKQGE